MAVPLDVSRSPELLHHFSTRKPSRPPIHNPYDKFTQSEFDAWIGGITGALKHALGQVEDAEQITEPHSPRSDASSDEGESVAAQLLQDENSAGEELEDSFADIRAREIGKGKARDPRDGPGIRGGDRNQPIEIDSDSEDEGQIPQEESEEDEGLDEWDEESDEEVEHPPWENGESSAQARIRHERERLESYEEDDYEHEVEEDYGEEEEHNGEYEEVYENRDTSGCFAETEDITVFSDNQNNREEDEEFPVHELVNEDESDDLDEEDEEESGSTLISERVTSGAYHSIRQPEVAPEEIEEPHIPGSVTCAHSYVLGKHPDVTPQEIDDEVEELHHSLPSEYEDCSPPLLVETEEVENVTQEMPAIHTFEGESFPPSQGVDVEEGDETRPTNTSEDEERLSRMTADAEEVDSNAQILEPEVMQPSDNETSDEIKASQPYFHVEIRDPWSGPRAYAEDYYSGGDVQMDLDSDRNANQIGSYDDESALVTPSGASQPQQSYGFDEQNTQGGSVIIDHETGRTPDRIISSPSPSLDPLCCSNSSKSREESLNLSPTRHEPTNDNAFQPNELSMPSLGAGVAMATLSNLNPTFHPIEFVHSHMVGDGPVERFMESGMGLVHLSDQPDTLTKDDDKEILTSPETRLGEPPAADAIPENAVDHAQDNTREGLAESSGTRNPAGAAPDEYYSSDQSAGLIEDTTPSEGERMGSDEQPEAQHTSYSLAHASNVVTTRPQDGVSSPEESSNVHTALVTDMDIESAKDVPNDVIRHGDVEEGPSINLTRHVQAASVTGSPSICESSGSDLSAEEANSKPIDLPDVDQAVTVGDEPCILMRDVEHGTPLEDECSGSLDQPSPYPSTDILRLQGTPEKHSENSLVTEENSFGSLIEVISPDVADMHERLPDHAPETEGALVLVEVLSSRQPAGLHPSTNGQEYKDINTQHTSSQSPPQYSADVCDMEDVWARRTSHGEKLLSPAREYLELDSRAELSPPTVTYDSWDAPHKFANGLISAGNGPFLLGGDPITHFVRDTIPAVFALLEIPEVSSHVQEKTNSDLDHLYDDLQSEPIGEIEQEIGMHAAWSEEYDELENMIRPTTSPSNPSGSRQTEAEASNRQQISTSSSADLCTPVPAISGSRQISKFLGSPNGVHSFSMDLKPTATSTEPVEISAAEFPQQTGEDLSSPRDETLAGQKASENTFTQSLSSHAGFNTTSGGAMILDKMVNSKRNGRRVTESQFLRAQSPPPALGSPSSVPVTMHSFTAPVLPPDPYPYSLSTPHALAEANSTLSTSTVRSEQENNHTLHGLAERSPETMQLQYPSLEQRSSARPSGVANGSKGEKREQRSLHDVGDEIDADGEIDPDFIGGSHRVLSSRRQDAGSSSAPNLRKSSESIAIPTEKNQVSSRAEQSDSFPLSSVSERETLVSATTVMGSKSTGELPSILIIRKRPLVTFGLQNETDSEELTDLDEPTPIKPQLTQHLKRRYSSSIMPASPTLPTKKLENKPKTIWKSDPKKTNSKLSITGSKGKGKEVRTQGPRKSLDTRRLSNPQSPGTVSPKISSFETRDSSRASSVGSNARSDRSSVVQPSPAVGKPNAIRPQPPLHKHSHALPQHRPAPPSFQPPPQTPMSLIQVDVTSTSVANHTKLSTSNQPGPSHKPMASLYSSPVTRSNCRYHKISIPRDEDGPRIYFLVPGCALTDQEVIEEEEVVDHGDATPEDTTDIDKDLESLAFDPYLVGVMRLLVGVNMWEQEVYYMRRIGEDGKELVPKLPQAPKIPVANLTSPHSSARGPTSPKAPLSAAASASTSASARKAREPDALSGWSYTDSELSDEGDHAQVKRARPIKAVAGGQSLLDSESISRRRKLIFSGGTKRSHASMSKELAPESRKSKKLRTSLSEPWTSR